MGGRLAVLALSAFSSFGCTSSEPEPAKDAGDPSNIPASCRGFDFEGLRYSPGGDALPNKCAAFDPTTNNPYAVRCVDALPGYATRYPGDELCILPPPPEKGAQLGIHPQGASYWPEIWAGDLSGYSNDALTKPFELEPGGEVEQTYRFNMENEEPHHYYRVDSRMRVGSHHLATYRTTPPGEEGWRPVTGAFRPEGAEGFFWNAQRSDADRPAGSLEIPPEDRGLGSPVDARQGILFDVHHFNTRQGPILREAWVNVWWVEGAVVQVVEDHPLVAPTEVPPNTIKDCSGSFSPDAPTRVLSLFGHRHAWTTHFNAWLHRADGSDLPVYDSFDWYDVPTYSYDSVAKNPAADPSMRQDGASSGILELAPGDVLNYNCHVESTVERARELGVPAPTQTLVFGNKAFEAEMCILYAQMATGQ